MLQVWGSAGFCSKHGMCVTGMGMGRFVFNIGYVCYRCGDRQVSVQNTVCVLQLWEWVDLGLI